MPREGIQASAATLLRAVRRVVVYVGRLSLPHNITRIAKCVACLSLAAAILVAPVDESNASPAVSAVHTADIITLLGTAGGPILDPKRSQPATLLELQGKRILIDCGEGTVVQLAKLGLKASDIDMVFLTHLHFDHTAGLPSLFAFSSIGAMKGISAYGPPGTDEVVADALNANRVPIDLFNVYRKPPVDRSALADSHVVDVASAPEVIYSTAGLRVLAVGNSHYGADTATFSYGRAKSYSYRFELPDRSIVFTGDTGPSAAVDRRFSGSIVFTGVRSKSEKILQGTNTSSCA